MLGGQRTPPASTSERKPCVRPISFLRASSHAHTDPNCSLTLAHASSQRCTLARSRVRDMEWRLLTLDDFAGFSRFVAAGSLRAASRRFFVSNLAFCAFFVCNPAFSTFAPPRLVMYSLPSIGPTCGGSRSRYGRPTPSSFSCTSIHFHSSWLDS